MPETVQTLNCAGITITAEPQQQKINPAGGLVVPGTAMRTETRLVLGVIGSVPHPLGEGLHPAAAFRIVLDDDPLTALEQARGFASIVTAQIEQGIEAYKTALEQAAAADKAGEN